MEIKYVYMGLLISFVLVIALWVLQRFFRKMKTLCLCSTVALIVIVAMVVLTDIFPYNESLLITVGCIFSPGFVVAAVFVKPRVAFDDLSPTFTILAHMFAVIFYSLVFWAIVEYARKKYFCSKTK